ncbi:hypothetical protein PQR33_31440 [Paraburkholderia sediminicola]|uniref:hypothetical protein n=1 Tax=Paraburkholderia sediminicola TaxID=458836 RepID=UPI0038BAE08C
MRGSQLRFDLEPVPVAIGDDVVTIARKIVASPQRTYLTIPQTSIRCEALGARIHPHVAGVRELKDQHAMRDATEEAIAIRQGGKSWGSCHLIADVQETKMSESSNGCGRKSPN